MAGHEDQAQKIVANIIGKCHVERSIEIRLGQLLLDDELAPQLLMFALQCYISPYPIDRAMLGGGHEPGARLVRDTRLRPALQGDHQRILRQVLGETHIAHEACQGSDELRRLDPPDRFNGALYVGCRHA